MIVINTKEKTLEIKYETVEIVGEYNPDLITNLSVFIEYCRIKQAIFDKGENKHDR